MLQFRTNPVSEPPLLRIEPFRGMNVSVTATQINQSESPEMLNLHVDERGALKKRTGYKRLFLESLGQGQINGIYEFKKVDGTSYFLIAHGTDLYKQEGEGQPISLFDTLADKEANFFTMNDKCYIMNGEQYLEFDGETVKEVEPYIPTLAISKEPEGGGSPHEEWNLLGNAFKDSFSSDGVATVYHLSMKDLDDTPIEVVVDNVTMEESSNVYSVDRKAGTVRFSIAPGKGTNNVIITAYKTFEGEFTESFNGKNETTEPPPENPPPAPENPPEPVEKKEFRLSRTEIDADTLEVSIDGGTTFNQVEDAHFTVDREKGIVTFVTAPDTGEFNVVIKYKKRLINLPKRIKKCRFHEFFGGSNDTRVFVAGNDEMPDYVWRSDLYNPTYFPENGFYKFPGMVKGFSRQYDYLIIERHNGKHLINFSLADGVASFPSKPINDQVGTLAEKSIQIIENNPVSLSKNGVYMLTSSNIRDERNVSHISEAIDPLLMKEENLDKAISIDFDNKYWIALNGKVYVLDYGYKTERFGEWYVYDNIHASCFLEMNNNLYFGSKKEGLVFRFKKETEIQPYNDDDTQPIVAYWKSKILNFGADERKKQVERVFFSLKPFYHTSADLYYNSDSVERTYISTTRKDLFSYAYLDYSVFSYATRDFPQESANKVKAKKIIYFQLELRNEKMDEAFSLLSIGIKYNYQSYAK